MDDRSAEFEKRLEAEGAAYGLTIAVAAGAVVLWFLQDYWGRGLSFEVAILVAFFLVVVGATSYAAVLLASSRWSRWHVGRTAEKTAVGLAVAGVIIGMTYLGLETFVGNRRPGNEVTAALKQACAGMPVSGAGAVDTGNINQIVVLDLNGNEHAWTGHPPYAWRPPSVAAARLVACISEEEERSVLQVCPYEGGAVTRYRISRRVVVVDASTGRFLADDELVADPRQCQQVESRDLFELAGTLEWATVQEHLAAYVERRP
jgi:hypothetical protein